MRFSLNLPGLFPGLSFEEAFRIMQQYRFDTLETWTLPDADVPALRDAMETFGMKLSAFCPSFFILNDPARRGEYESALIRALRTADALEVPVVLSDGCADPYSDKAVRASMGAVFRTQPQQAPQAEILRACAAQKIPLAVTAMTHDAQDIRTAALGTLATVIGSEGRGVGRAYFEAAQQRLIIPMSARCESLNAAVAATIVMWQMKR